MRVAVSGATGMVGQALTEVLEGRGDQVVPLTRDEGGEGICWAPLEGVVGPGLESVDAVVHLAGEPIDGSWDAEHKQRIRQSRVVGTRTLATALAGLPPRVFVSTSACGIYGDRGDEVLTEASEPGGDFLAEVGIGWEAELAPLSEAGWRVAVIRTGLALSGDGGLLSTLLPLFKVGGGGPLGPGTQYMPWISLTDLVRLYVHCLDHDVSGAFNGAAPGEATNRTFVKTLGQVLNRPAIVPAPAFAIRLVMGAEKAEALALASQRARPARALDAGFVFEHPDLETALRAELDR